MVIALCPVAICMTGRMKVPSNFIPKMVANASAGAIPSSFTCLWANGQSSLFAQHVLSMSY